MTTPELLAQVRADRHARKMRKVGSAFSLNEALEHDSLPLRTMAALYPLKAMAEA